MKSLLIFKKNIDIFFLLILSLLPLFAFFHAGFPITHDGQDHIARIANFYKNISEGIFIPRWAGNLNWGYGHPVLMFLYPFPSYLASLFHVIGFSFVDSTKLVFVSSYILSGMTMYLFLNKNFKKDASFLGALLYLYAPYRFVDLYVRGAIGEHVAFAFVPLVLYSMVSLASTFSYRYFLSGCFSLAFLILSHNAISLMFLPIIFLYGLFLLSKNKKRLSVLFSVMILLGFGLSAFFWLPGLKEGKYTLRDIVTSKDYSSRFVSLNDFFDVKWSYGGADVLSKQVGIIQWAGVILGIFLILTRKKMKQQERRLLLFALIFFFGTLFIMTSVSKFLWDNISLIQKFQFPWRFLSLSVFLTSIIGAQVYDVYKPRKYIFFILIFILIFLHFPYMQAKGYSYKSDDFYSGIYLGTTDTGESAPIWSVRFMEHVPPSPLEIIEGNAEVFVKKRLVTQHIYRVNVSEKTRFRENTLYFPGWKVIVDGVVVPIEFQDPQNRGLMTFSVNPGEHHIEVLFTQTKLRQIADIISLTSLGLLFIAAVFFRKKVL